MERGSFPRSIKVLCPNKLVKANSHGNSAAGGYDNMMNKFRHSVRSVGEIEARALCITLMQVRIVRYITLLRLFCHVPVDEAPQIDGFGNTVLFALLC